MIVTTAEVNAKIAQDEKFAKDVSKAMARFLRKDWGDKSADCLLYTSPSPRD